MTTYKLTYFQAKGRAEVIRYVFAQAGVKYEDVRLSGEEWAKVKPSTPFGQMPFLEVDGKVISGSGVIARYLGETFGLAGSNALENAEIAGISDFLDDFGPHFGKFYSEKDEEKKAEVKKDILENQVPRFFGKIDKLIAANEAGWIYGGKVTYLDLRIAVNVRMISMLLGQDISENLPALTKLVTTVEALPPIAKWIADRPDTQH